MKALVIGQRLDVGVREEDGLRWYPSRLEDLDDRAEHLVIAWPTDTERRLVRLFGGDLISVSASAPQDALYSAEMRVEGAKRAGLPLLQVRLRGGWQRVQRRDAVRIPVAIRPALAEVVAKDGHRRVRVGINNISAGGLQIRSQDELRIGDCLELVFGLPGDPLSLHARAEVRRVQLDDNVWEAGCQFSLTSRADSQRIVQFIFAQQRALAQRMRGR